jgi:hypothetical protein
MSQMNERRMTKEQMTNEMVWLIGTLGNWLISILTFSPFLV